MLLPTHLVHADRHQSVEPVLVETVGDHTGADPAHGVPVDALQAGDGGLVGTGGQVGDDVFEITG
ncbi:MAG: hypothetical protein JO362_03300 [Streptomycetaceae bacterium]|nr:hypothetical protein [Streptomycetaceae bacterium]